MTALLVIGCTGRTGSGKSTFSKMIQDGLGGPSNVTIISMDDLYLPLSQEEHEKALRNEKDFDDLSAFDIPLLKKLITQAKRGFTLRYHLYDHAEHRHSEQEFVSDPTPIVIFEGLYLLSDESIRQMFDYTVFLDIDGDESLLRRIRRDIVKRRRNVQGVLDQYEKYVKPAYHRLVEPVRRHCDVCIPHGSYNRKGYETVLSFVEKTIKSSNCS